MYVEYATVCATLASGAHKLGGGVRGVRKSGKRRAHFTPARQPGAPGSFPVAAIAAVALRQWGPPPGTRPHRWHGHPCGGSPGGGDGRRAATAHWGCCWRASVESGSAVAGVSPSVGCALGAPHVAVLPVRGAPWSTLLLHFCRASHSGRRSKRPRQLHGVAMPRLCFRWGVHQCHWNDSSFSSQGVV